MFCLSNRALLRNITALLVIVCSNLLGQRFAYFFSARLIIDLSDLNLVYRWIACRNL